MSTMTEVKFLRLSTGEDIISEVLLVKEDSIEKEHAILFNPMKIVYGTVRGQSNQMSLSFMQWVFTKISEEQEFKIYTKDIIVSGNPNEDLIDYYYDTVKFFEDKKTRTKNIEDTYPDTDFDDVPDLLKQFLDKLKIDKNKLN